MYIYLMMIFGQAHNIQSFMLGTIIIKMIIVITKIRTVTAEF